MAKMEIPLFPLNSVLFPEGPLPLRIFEPRYLDMVGNCLRNGTGFGVSLIRDGEEVGEAATTYEIGTFSRIMDWHQRHDGLLGITIIGEQRYRTLSSKVQKDQLTEATVELLPNEPSRPVPEEYIPMADFLRQLIKQIPHLFASIEKRYDDSTWVGYRLSELLPIPLEQKQFFLQIEEPIQRLERLRTLMESMDIHY